jgi:hypothetical protein
MSNAAATIDNDSCENGITARGRLTTEAPTMEDRLRKYLHLAQSGDKKGLLNLMMACASCPAAAEVVAREERKRVEPKQQ